MATILDPRKLHGAARDAVIASNWWAAAIRGVSAIVLGSIAIFMPAVALVGIVIIFAAYCIVDGIFAIVLAIRGARKHERWGWLAFNGVISLLAAAVAIFYPDITILALVILFAAWALISGVATIVAASRLPRRHGRFWLIAGGVIAILFAILVIFSPPLGMLTLSFVVGFQALFAGFTLLALAFQLRARAVEAAGGGGGGGGRSERADGARRGAAAEVRNG
jgi:uncharacterized membrane protein HdeD (DUF308 family)